MLDRALQCRICDSDRNGCAPNLEVGENDFQHSGEAALLLSKSVLVWNEHLLEVQLCAGVSCQSKPFEEAGRFEARCRTLDKIKVQFLWPGGLRAES